MTIKMRLDTDGLRALIKDNPQIGLEIGKDAKKLLQELVTPEMARDILREKILS